MVNSSLIYYQSSSNGQHPHACIDYLVGYASYCIVVVETSLSWRISEILAYIDENYDVSRFEATCISIRETALCGALTSFSLPTYR